MATIVNNPNPGPERVVTVERSDSSTGWAIAVIVLIIVIAGLFWWVHARQMAPAPAAQQPAQGGAASVNVTIPTGGDNGADTGGTDTGTGADADGSASGAAQ